MNPNYLLIAACVCGVGLALAFAYLFIADSDAEPSYFHDHTTPPVPVLEAESGDPLLRERINRTSPADWHAVGEAFAKVSPSLSQPAFKGTAHRPLNRTDFHRDTRRASVAQIQSGRK